MCRLGSGLSQPRHRGEASTDQGVIDRPDNPHSRCVGVLIGLPELLAGLPPRAAVCLALRWPRSKVFDLRRVTHRSSIENPLTLERAAGMPSVEADANVLVFLFYVCWTNV